MTTAVTVAANHGWPVRVTEIYKGITGTSTTEARVIVKAGELRTFAVHCHCDLLIHELQPDEMPPELIPPPDE